jgi:hypothetical protein
MAGTRDAHGRFAPKPREALSPTYARRIARGTAQGHALSRARGHGTRAVPAWQTATISALEPYRRSLDVLGHMRHGQSLYQASREQHIAPDTVQRYVGTALVRGPDGRYSAKPNDRLYRRMKFLDERGLLAVDVANSREASKLADYMNTVRAVIVDGADPRRLKRFDRMRLRLRDKSVRRFVTDPDVLDRLAHAGELSFEDLYELAA